MLHSTHAIKRMRILIVDADDTRRDELTRMLSAAGFQGLLTVAGCDAASERVADLIQRGAGVDLAVVGASNGTPGRTELCAELRAHEVELIETNGTDETPVILRARIEACLTRRHYEAELVRAARQSRHLFVESLEMMTRFMAAKDVPRQAHSDNVAKLSITLARRMRLPEEMIETVRIAGQLHDLGMIGVHEEIMHKPGALSEEEMEEIRRHPEVAAAILEPLGDLRDVVEAVRCHHERWDGSGYPQGLAGEAIPITARIIAVAEVFDVMTSDSPEAPARSADQTLEMISREAGVKFDPEVIAALKKVCSAEQ